MLSQMNFLISILSFNETSPLSKETISLLKTKFKISNHQKGDIIDTSSSATKKISFIRKGMVRGFVNYGGQEITNWISIENELFTTADFFGENLFIESAQAIEETTLEYLELDDYEELFHRDDYTKLAQSLMTKYYVWANRRAFISRIPDSKKRLDFFVKNYDKEIIKRCPNKHLASFLNMRPETLSRLINSLDIPKTGI